MKQIIEYYDRHNRPVYLCYLDASKAFDKINHWHLFSKLLDRKFPPILVRLLITWYTLQTYIVQWSSYISEPFNVTNGVPQGRIMSPSFFNVYMDELSVILNDMNVGCMIQDVTINHMFYADDSVLLAPSPIALQQLLDTCFKYASEFELKYNKKKTVSMCIKPKWLKDIHVPNFVLDGNVLKSVSIQKYLGCVISDNLSDNNDICRQLRCTYARGNMIIKKFKYCTDEVKVKLFKAYCTNFYGSCIWARFTKACIRKLTVAYKRIFRGFMLRDFDATTYQMLELNIDPFNVIERKLIYGFQRRLFLSDNDIVIAILASDIFYDSPLYKRWINTIF